MGRDSGSALVPRTREEPSCTQEGGLSLAQPLPVNAMQSLSKFIPTLMLTAIAAACGPSAPTAAGMETSPCIDGGCFGDLVCLSDVCVAGDSDGASSDGQSGNPSGSPTVTTQNPSTTGTTAPDLDTTATATEPVTGPVTESTTGPRPDGGVGGDGFCEDLGAGVYCREGGLDAVTCGENGEVISDENCVPGICAENIGCVVCTDGQFDCLGDRIMECDVSGGAPHRWVELGICDPASGERCDAQTGMCEPSTPVGDATPTGVYFEFVTFSTEDSPFLGGYDVDSKGDKIYTVSINGPAIDEYTVELLDSDADGELEPNQHPDNPDATGPVEERVLTFVRTIDPPKALQPSVNEIFALDDRLFVGGTEITETILMTGATTTVTSVPPWINRFSQIAFDEVSGIWYASNESARRVYGYNEATDTWGIMFDYPELAGSHMDGLEVVTDPTTGTPFIYVSDMTSTFIGQYRKDPDLGWVQDNIFSYQGSAEQPVEGMGFGAHDHFWATSGATLFELGGGDLAGFTERR